MDRPLCERNPTESGKTPICIPICARRADGESPPRLNRHRNSPCPPVLSLEI